jgi:hypothetical protein
LVGSARSLGIKTAEFQHGAISAGHDGYNFAPTLIDSSEYRQTLPDYFLSYGAWWVDQINAPLKKVIIGNPNRDKVAAVEAVRERRVCLVLGDGFDFDLYANLVTSLQPLVRKAGVTVVFRPHPLERSQVIKRADGLPFEIDMETDIHTSLRGAFAVVSEVSTGVFDAIGLADRQFVWDTPKTKFVYPAHPCVRFSTAEELAELLANSWAGRVSDATASAIWAAGWRTNFIRFLTEIGVIK